MPYVGKSFDSTVDQTTLFMPGITTGGAQKRGLPMFVNADTGEDEPFDIWDLKKSGRIASTVLGRLGVKGHGKTAENIKFAVRYGARQAGGRRLSISLSDFRYANGQPEYARLAEFFGTEEVRLSSYQLNLLASDLGLTEVEQLDMVRYSLEHERGQRFDVDEAKALRYGLKKVHELFPGTAEMAHLAICLWHLSPADVRRYQNQLYTDLVTRHPDDKLALRKVRSAAAHPTVGLLDAAVRVANIIEELLDGSYGRMFGGKHSLASIMQTNNGLAAWDFTGLNDSAITQVQSMMWRVKTSAMRRKDHKLFYDMEAHDENHKAWKDPVFARAMYEFMKEIRSTSTFVMLNTHRLGDYARVGAIGSETYQLATGMIDDIDLWMLGKHRADAANDTAERLGLTQEEATMLLSLERGVWGLKIGTEPVRWVRSALTDIEKQLSYSDAANDEMAIA